MAAGEYPELRLKAWTSRLITAFLAVALQDVCSQFTDADRPAQLTMATAACAKLSEWMLLLERYPKLLTQNQADHLYAVSWEILDWSSIVFMFKNLIIVVFFPLKIASDSQNLLARFLDIYQVLADNCVARGELQYPIKPKHHVSWEVLGKL